LAKALAPLLGLLLQFCVPHALVKALQLVLELAILVRSLPIPVLSTGYENRSFHCVSRIFGRLGAGEMA
jgi:hypothetical protein